MIIWSDQSVGGGLDLYTKQALIEFRDQIDIGAVAEGAPNQGSLPSKPLRGRELAQVTLLTPIDLPSPMGSL
jgi:hypothetical protein